MTTGLKFNIQLLLPSSGLFLEMEMSPKGSIWIHVAQVPLEMGFQYDSGRWKSEITLEWG